MKRIPLRFSVVCVALTLGACVTYPTGPSAMALPGSGKSFDQFRADDGDCRQFAAASSGAGTPNQAQANSTVTGAAVGTALGAVAGAALGGNSSGAAAGAGVGLLAGTAAGAGAGQGSAYEAQRRYDHGYIQCMYSKGHKVPVSGRFVNSSPTPSYSSAPPPPPPSYGAPPPSYGAPPPPPYGAPPPPPPR